MIFIRWQINLSSLQWLYFLSVRIWTLCICLTMESLWMLITMFRLQYCYFSSGNEVDSLCVSFCSMSVCCYWCILILIIILVARWCSLIGPHWLAVVSFDCGFPSLGNFDSTIPVDVFRVKSYMDSLFDPMHVPVGVTISEFSQFCWYHFALFTWDLVKNTVLFWWFQGIFRLY